MQIKRTKQTKLRRNWRSRAKIFGTADRPRLVVFRSSRHIYAQVIDDKAGVTLASASTMCKAISEQLGGKNGGKAAAEVVGAAIAKQATGVGINCVSFDRNGCAYHGRIKALADAARKAGLAF